MKAYETELTFSGVTAPGVVVEFGKPWRLIFWSRAQYVACWDLGKGVWFTPEWLETNSPEDFHCYEPIMDKKLKYSNVRIVESGEARAKIHWNYACCDMRYRVFNGNTTADEYYTVYPDGVAVRKLVAWPGNASDQGGNPNFWEILEWILINAKGTTPDETLEKDVAFTFMNDKGDEITFSWPLPVLTGYGNPSLCESHPEIADWNVYIGRVHVRDRPDPYVIFAKDKRIFPYKPCTQCNRDHPKISVFEGGSNIFKHWPVTTMEDFVLAVNAGDEVGKVAIHSSFMNCQYTSIPGDRPPRPTTWLFLTGATEQPSSFLVELAKSWLNPAKVKTGYERDMPWGMACGRVLFEGYAYSERAYTFRKFEEDQVKFTMTPNVPVFNPVFIINGWKSPLVKVTLNGKVLEKEYFKWQQIKDDLVVWVNQKVVRPTEVEISYK